MGITTIVMWLAWRTRCKWVYLTVLFFYVLMCLSTVYILAHYAIDAIAGLISGTLLYFLLKAVWLRWRF